MQFVKKKKDEVSVSNYRIMVKSLYGIQIHRKQNAQKYIFKLVLMRNWSRNISVDPKMTSFKLFGYNTIPLALLYFHLHTMSSDRIRLVLKTYF